MARKPSRKPARKSTAKSPRRPAQTFDEQDLNKGQVRKLNALRKSVGEDIGAQAFAKWLAIQQSEAREPADKNAKIILSVLEPLIETKQLRIPRGGYLLSRGRGRLIITRGDSN